MTNSICSQHRDDWLWPEQIAELEGTGAEWVRKKYIAEANRRRNPDEYARAVRHNGGLKFQFRVRLLDEETQEKYLASKSSPEQTALAPFAPRLFPAEIPESAASSAMPKEKLRAAQDKDRILTTAERLRGREIHGERIDTLDDAFRILARDSKEAQPALADWSRINRPISKGTLFRWHGFREYQRRHRARLRAEEERCDDER